MADHTPTYRPAAQPDNLDIDRAMWTGYTPAPRVEMPEAPSPARQRELPVGEEWPKVPLPPMFPWFAQRNCTPYQCPTPWAQPFHSVSEICLPFYATEYTVWSYHVPDTRILVLQELGYEFGGFAIGEQLLIRVRRDQEVMAEWVEYVVAISPNPAHRYLFGGVNRPIPVKLRVDRAQALTVTVTAIGPFPNNRTPADALNINAKMLVYGYLDQLRDTREGGFRPRVAGGERGQDHWHYIPEAARKFLAAMPHLQPYFAQRLDLTVESQQFIEEQRQAMFYERGDELRE